MIALHYLTTFLLVLVVAASARHHHRELKTEVQNPEQSAVEEPELDTRPHRRKRWYSGYEYQQPAYRYDAPPSPPNPFDPFAYIFKRLDELTALVRQPQVPQAPIYVPYPVYLPSCGCPAAGATPHQPTAGAPNGTVDPFVGTRFGDNDNDDYDDIPLRPINFDPVVPEKPLSRPIPSVEHGSVQAGASPTGQQGREPTVATFGSSSPSKCQVAVLTCCHQRHTTNRCFQDFGCPTALNGGNPCDANALRNVIGIFQNFYRDPNVN